MNTKLQTKEKGFTIIEVLIVLAIAGLIMLIVFLAVPALQRNSRNTQRRNDVSALLGAYQEAVNNNNGAVPATDCNGSAAGPPPCWVRNAKTSNYDNNSANVIWNQTASYAAPATPTLEQVIIQNFAKCNGNAATGTNATSRSVVVMFLVETSGDPVVQCQES